MDIDIIIKIAIIGLIVAILNQILVKSGREDYALIAALAGIAVVLMMLLPQLSALLSGIQTIFNF